MLVLFFSALSYFMGSLCSAVMVCRLCRYPDPRTVGSNNPGASNVHRVAGRKAAALTLCGDALKSLLPVLLAKCFGVGDWGQGLVVLSAVFGHVCPIFFGFKGGKGVATALGGIWGISLWLGFITVMIWLAVVAWSRYASLASLLSLCLVPVGVLITGHAGAFFPMLCVAGIVCWRHRENMVRLRRGHEHKINL